MQFIFVASMDEVIREAIIFDDSAVDSLAAETAPVPPADFGEPMVADA
jgi:hypothetical protein